MKMAKKTVAGLSKRCDALAVPQAVLRRQKSHEPSHRGHMVKLRLSSHISWLKKNDEKKKPQMRVQNRDQCDVKPGKVKRARTLRRRRQTRTKTKTWGFWAAAPDSVLRLCYIVGCLKWMELFKRSGDMRFSAVTLFTVSVGWAVDLSLHDTPLARTGSPLCSSHTQTWLKPAGIWAIPVYCLSLWLYTVCVLMCSARY